MQRKNRKSFRKKIAKVHLVLALVFCVPILLLAITGCILSFEREIEHALYPGLYKVEPQEGTLPVQTLYETVVEHYPEKKINVIRLPLDVDESIQFVTRGSIPTQIFLNPYTGVVIADRSVAKSFTTIVRGIHVSFLAGKIGSRVAGVCALLLLVTLFSGFYLWWSSQVRKKKSFFKVRYERGWFIANFDFHNLTGVLIMVPLGIICITGAVFSYPEIFRPIIYKATMSSPPPPRPTKIEVPAGEKVLNLDLMLELSRKEAPETKATVIGLPRSEDAPLRVNRKAPEETHITGRHYTFINPWLGKVVEQRSPEDAPLGTRAIMANRVLHTGQIGGMGLRIAFFFVVFFSIPLVVTGLIHWRGPKKKRVRKNTRANRPQANLATQPLKPVAKS